MSKHPMQPLVRDARGVIRFKQNAIVVYLLDLCKLKGICDMNDLALLPISDDDRTQFAQLIGYSVSGAGELPYFDPDVLERADTEAETL